MEEIKKDLADKIIDTLKEYINDLKPVSRVFIYFLMVMWVIRPKMSYRILKTVLTWVETGGFAVGGTLKGVRRWAGAALGTIAAMLTTHFTPKRRLQWAIAMIVYLLTAVSMISFGLIAHKFSLFLFAGTVLLLAPIIIVAAMLSLLFKEKSKIWTLAMSVIRVCGIFGLIAVGWMFIENKEVYGIVLVLWLGLVLTLSFFIRSSDGLKPTIRSLALFVGLCLLSKVGMYTYDSSVIVNRTVDASHNFALGKSARFLGKGTLEKDAGELQDFVAIRNTKLWVDEPKGTAAKGFSLDLHSGDTIAVVVTKSSQDNIGMIYYQARQFSLNGSSNDGWVAARHLEKLEKIPRAPTTSQASSVHQTIPNEFTFFASEGVRELGWVEAGQSIKLVPTLLSQKLDFSKCEKHSECRQAWATDFRGARGEFYGELLPDAKLGTLLIRLPGENWRIFTRAMDFYPKQSGNIYVAVNGNECATLCGEIKITYFNTSNVST